MCLLQDVLKDFKYSGARCKLEDQGKVRQGSPVGTDPPVITPSLGRTHLFANVSASLLELIRRGKVSKISEEDHELIS